MRFVYILLICALSFGCTNDARKAYESLVYISSRDGNFDLYGIDVLGQWEKRLTTNPGWDWSPQWNPALERLVYYSNDSTGRFSVRSKALPYGQVDSLRNSQLVNFKLTPDGEKILYTQKQNESQQIWWCNRDGTEPVQLTNSESYNGRFSMSPNGDKLLFISDRTGQNELYLLDVKSKALQRLTDNTLIEKYTTWAPDGKSIALTLRSDEEGSKEDIYILDLESNALTQLTNTAYGEVEIAWSPSGDKIAFHGATEEGDHIYTIDVADGKFIKITSGDAYHGEPTWVPLDL